jgi:hypothetical protein
MLILTSPRTIAQVKPCEPPVPTESDSIKQEAGVGVAPEEVHFAFCFLFCLSLHTRRRYGIRTACRTSAYGVE